MKNLSILSIFPVVISLMSSCKKSETAGNCENIQKVKITGAKTSYYVGDTIWLQTNIVPLGLYSWNQTNALNAISSSEQVFIPYCTKNDEGWYYLNVSHPDCASHNDSVYLKVINKPVAAPCTPANNTVTFSAIPSISFGSASWGLDPSWNYKNLQGSQSYGYPDFNIYFNPYWNDKEPEDGEYKVSNGMVFDNNVSTLYSVCISSTYSSIFFQASGTDGKVYVSHVSGKIQVSFCSLPLSGDWGGTLYRTTATGRLTAP